MTAIASKSQLRMSLLRYALVTVPLLLLLGTFSARISNSGYGNAWFDALVKPAALPPGWAFPVAWTILYILLGLALAIVLHARGARRRGLAVGLFLGQMVLNYAWSPIFFGMHQVRLALFVIAAMFGMSVATAVLFGKIRRNAALLMLPYLTWLCFAAYLNYQVIVLNPGAENLVPADGSADITL
jgi:tryptophan-rich sensory protein